MIDVYIQNRVDTNLIINKKKITFIEIFEKIKLLIDHIRI